MRVMVSQVAGRLLTTLAGFVAAVSLAACDPTPQVDVSTNPSPPTVQYTLTVSGEPAGGQITVDERSAVLTCPVQPSSPCTKRVLPDAILTLEAQTDDGWRFDRWENCEVARSAKIVIKMPKQDLECKARLFNFVDAFDVAVLPDRIATFPGTPATAQLRIERGASFGTLPVSFELIDPPGGVTLSAPASGVAGTVESLSLDVPRSASPGQYQLVLRATARDRNGQDVERRVTLTLVIQDLSGFRLQLDTPTLAISRGTTCQLSVVADRDSGFTDPINLSAAPLPPGVTAAFEFNPTQGNVTGWSVTAADDAAFGEQMVSVVGSARALARRVDLRVAVTAAQDSCATGHFSMPTNDDFSVSASATSIAVPQGQSATVDIGIDRSLGYLGDVDLTVGGAPVGALLKFNPPSPVSGNGTRLQILTAEGATRGISTIIVTATGNSRIHQASFQLAITPGAMTCPLGVVADSTVNPSSLQSALNILLVGSNSLLRAYKSYLAFDAARIPQPFERVDLVVSLQENSWATADPTSTRTVSLFGVIDDRDWSPSLLAESAINWSNAPKNDTASTYGFVGAGSTPADPVRALGTIVTRATDANTKQFRVDVTDYVRWGLGLKPDFSSFAPRDADGLLTFLMGNNLPYHAAGDNDWTAFYARENPQACLRPHLEVYR